MTGWHLLILLSAWFIFEACQSNNTLCMVQATDSENIKVHKLQTRSMGPGKTHVHVWDEKKPIRKKPSGPNPVGNQRPPTRP